MFGFFKKQSKNKLETEHAEPVITPVEDSDLLELRRRLEARVHDLNAQITKKDAEANKLKDELGDTRRQLEFRTAGMDRYQAELQSAYKETECARRTLALMKDEVTKFRLENEDLKEKLARKEEEAAQSSEEESDDEEEHSSGSRGSRRAVLEARVTELEEQLAEVTREKNALLTARESQECDRQEEIKIIQNALEAAVADKEAARARFEKDYEALRTVNSDREQQMLDDFEWKLRQVEQSAKKRVEEKAREAEKRALELRAELDKETAAHNRDLERLRRTEAEARELREQSHEQQRLIRAAQREHDNIHVSERAFKEEITRLNAQLDKEKSILAAVQSLNQKKLDERERVFEFRLERQKQDVTKEVEQRVRNELASVHRDEMLEFSRKCKEEHELELAKVQKQSQNKTEASHRQVSALRDQLAQKDVQHLKELRESQGSSDRDMIELRRQLDKLDMSYQDKIDALVEKHSSELEEAERRAAQVEIQVGQLRTTLELVKEQMSRDSEQRMAELQHHHRQQLARQHEELSECHHETLTAIQAKHEAEIAALVKARSNGDIEVDPGFAETLNKLRKQDLIISDLTSTIREQDHALTTLTQEKRALQLQMQRCSNSNSNVEIRELTPPLGLERISECTEPSSSTNDVIFTGDVTEPPSPCMTPISRHSLEDQFEECEDAEIQKITLNLPLIDSTDSYLSITPSDIQYSLSSASISKSASNPELSTSESGSNSSHELQVPRTYYLSHSPDSIFPKEKSKLMKSKSLGLLFPQLHLLSKSSSCPSLLIDDYIEILV